MISVQSGNCPISYFIVLVQIQYVYPPPFQALLKKFKGVDRFSILSIQQRCTNTLTAIIHKVYFAGSLQKFSLKQRLSLLLGRQKKKAISIPYHHHLFYGTKGQRNDVMLAREPCWTISIVLSEPWEIRPKGSRKQHQPRTCVRSYYAVQCPKQFACQQGSISHLILHSRAGHSILGILDVMQQRAFAFGSSVTSFSDLQV